MHGYEIITELEARSDGRWRPSPGSIYPTLYRLEQRGVLSSSDVDGIHLDEPEHERLGIAVATQVRPLLD